ncbi:MAG: DNA primase [Candidatus Jorgensenbacteria bacterium]
MATSTDVDRIKEKLNIVDFIRGYLTLLPAGKNFKALCPFHPEKTPSFIVSPDRQRFHCFGCAADGDLVTFLMRYENLEFPEALRVLAEKAGVPLQTLSPREQREFGVLYDIHEKAKEFFQQTLREHGAAQAYLKNRGLKGETAAAFELGFAPGGESLTVHLINQGFDVGDIVRAGLSHKNTAGLYRDRFINRIIFPIMNSVGKTVAFTGRLLPLSSEALAKDGEGAAGEGTDAPKYLNSPETPIFNKSKILYGFHLTKNDIAKARNALFVEGQMDLLMAWQAGVKNVVAVSGTALTPFHLEKLRRLAETMILSFDSDEAGIHALERSLDLLNNFDFHVKVVDLGGFKDPAEAAEKDPGFLAGAVASATSAFSHLFAHYFPRDNAGARELTETKRIVRNILQRIRRLKSATEQTAWIKDLAKYSGISEVMLLQELSSLPAPSAGSTGAPEEAVGEKPKLTDRADVLAERLLGLAFTNGDFLATLREKGSWLPARYQTVLGEPDGEAGAALQMQASYLSAQLSPDRIAKEFSDLIRQLEISVLEREQRELKGTIQKAEGAGDEKTLTRAAERFHSLAKRIDELKL